MSSCGLKTVTPRLEDNFIRASVLRQQQLLRNLNSPTSVNTMKTASMASTTSTAMTSAASTVLNGGDSNSTSGNNGDIVDPNETPVMKLARKVNKFYFGGYRQNTCKPFYCDGIQLGLIKPEVENALAAYPDTFHISAESVTLNPALKTFDERSARLDTVLREIRQKNVFTALRGWRNENYEIKPTFNQPPLFRMERSATSLFGFRRYGIDINGYTNHPEHGLCIWMQRRAKTKQTWPGMMDNLAAGGLSEGYSVLETAIKEVEEEANVPFEIAKNLSAAGCVSFFFESERGIFPETEFVFDLELPSDFVPTVNDGEAENFELVPIDEVLTRIMQSDVKTTSTPITMDFLVRKGIINPENEPNFPELIENLHIPVHKLYNTRPNTATACSPNREP